MTARARPSMHNRVVLAVLGSRAHHLLDQSLTALRVRGVVSGAELRFPVMYAADDAGLVVVPGRPAKKRWWRNLRQATPVHVLLNGQWCAGTGEVLHPSDSRYDEAAHTYRRRWPRVAGLDVGPVVRVWLERRAAEASSIR